MPVITNVVAYQKLVLLFHRMKYLAAVEVLLGLFVGLMVHGTPRTVIWVVTGFVAVWTFITAFLQQRRYQRVLDGVQRNKRDSVPVIPAPDTPPKVSSASDDEREARRVAAMKRFERQFSGVALLGLAIAVAGIAWGFFLTGPAQAVVISGVGSGGLLMALLFFVIKKRMRTGPKAAYLREVWKGY